MKKYIVESREYYTEIFDNWASDYIEAESEEEAIEFYKDWLLENGCTEDKVEEMEYRAYEYGKY